jgi:hypothetical protein
MEHNGIDKCSVLHEVTAVIHVTDRTCFLEYAIYTALESALSAGNTQIEVSCNSKDSLIQEKVDQICSSLGVRPRHIIANSFFEHFKASTARCGTKYIVLLHDDDYVHVDFFTEIRRLTESYPEASAFGVTTAFDISNTIYVPAIKGAREFWISPLIVAALYMAKRSGPAFPSLVYKRNFLLTLLPPPVLLGMCGDVHIASRCAEAGMIISSKPSFYYRLHSMNISKDIDHGLRLAVTNYSAKFFLSSLVKYLSYRNFWSNFMYLVGCFFKRRKTKVGTPISL